MEEKRDKGIVEKIEKENEEKEKRYSEGEKAGLEFYETVMKAADKALTKTSIANVVGLLLCAASFYMAEARENVKKDLGNIIATSSNPNLYR